MDYELGRIQKYILLVLSINNNEPVKGMLWFQKELFLISKNLSELEKEASFESDFMGPFSENAEEELRELELDGYVDISGKIRITREGKKLFEKIKNSFSKEEFEIAEDIKTFLNDLSRNELLAFIYFSYPNMSHESLVKEDIEKKRVELAINLYKKNKISIEKASEISGLPIEKLMKLIQ